MSKPGHAALPNGSGLRRRRSAAHFWRVVRRLTCENTLLATSTFWKCASCPTISCPFGLESRNCRRKVGKDGHRSRSSIIASYAGMTPTASDKTIAFQSRHRVNQTPNLVENDWSLSVPELADAWASCKRCHTFTIARLGKVCSSWERKSFPPNAVTVSEKRFPGAKRGFASWQWRNEEVQLHGQPHEVWMNLDPSVIDRKVTGAYNGHTSDPPNYRPGEALPLAIEGDS